MPPKDKMLARLSDWATLAVFAGIVVVVLLPGPRPSPKRDQAPAVTPPRINKMQPAAPPPAASARDTVQRKPSEPSGETPPAKPVVDAWTKAEEAAGLRACLRLMAPIAAEITLEEPMKKGPCGSPAPVVLHSIGTAAKVRFDPAPRMNCRLAARLARWVERVLQPAAREVLGSRITRIVGASSYACRNIYNKPNLPLSQHATGAAIDIPRFVTADGRRISVVKGWGPTERDIAAAKKKIAEAAKAEAKRKAKAHDNKTDAKADKASKKDSEAKVHKAGFKTDARARATMVAAAGVTASQTSAALFLKRLHHGACTLFGTVLGPEANEAHRNHFHFDVKERKRRGICH
jgi:hypothetical protein